MNKEVTVDKALIKYQQINNVVIVTASIACAVAFFFTFHYFSNELIFFLVVCIYVFLFAACVAGFPTFNIWKFWAFSRVGNVHELKKRLILLGHVSEENIFFKKIENSTENDKKYRKIRLKFAQEDIFVDDEAIPEETLVYYSKTISIMIIVLMLPLFTLGILLLLFAIDELPIVAVFGIFFLIGAVVLGYFFGYKKLINRKPQLTLNNKGISTKKKGFHKWEEIERCVIVTGNIGLLKYTHSRGHENVAIKELNIKNNGIKLSKLLMVYRERNKLQNNRR